MFLIDLELGLKRDPDWDLRTDSDLGIDWGQRFGWWRKIDLGKKMEMVRRMDWRMVRGMCLWLGHWMGLSLD